MIDNKIGKTILFLVVIILAMTFVSCRNLSHNDNNSIHIKGSYTMYELTQELAAEFMVTYPGISVYVEGGGTATGFKGLKEGTIDIAMASRLIQSDEASLLADKYNTLGLSYLVAKDALSIYINKENPVNDLSLKQLKSIFTGEYKNWKEVGGLDTDILIALRPPTSGTHVYFNEYVLENAGYAENNVSIPSNTVLFEYIQDNKNAIGFAGIYSPATVKKCLISGVAANEENVINDSYPLIRYLYFYTINKPFGVRKKFIDWVLSHEGQQIVKKVGFIPLWL
ncbi:MAG: PstS family phosphate ABC transporter substrate-binding protein [Calditrichaceae bacterium]|nr:PstS family phosphate ABC transporter substrate-binding protein [Calditrichaceae bacterium]